MGFKSFPKYRLEELIGVNTLNQLSIIVPVLDSKIEKDKIYQKSNLIKILHSFFDSNIFSKKEIRNEFLGS